MSKKNKQHQKNQRRKEARRRRREKKAQERALSQLASNLHTMEVVKPLVEAKQAFLDEAELLRTQSLSEAHHRKPVADSFEEHASSMTGHRHTQHRIKTVFEAGGNEEYMRDGRMWQRYEAMCTNHRDVVESYLMHFRPDPRNTHVFCAMGNTPGEAQDIKGVGWRHGPDPDLTKQQIMGMWRRSLEKAQIFAMPRWWAESRIMNRRIENIVSASQLTDHPLSTDQISDGAGGYLDLLEQESKNPIPPEVWKRVALERWERNATEHLFPDQMPFRRMVVMLEHEEELLKTEGKMNPGLRVYNRFHNDTLQVREMGCPSAAYLRDRSDPVPLDFLYVDGFLWDGSRTEWHMEGKSYDMIWALCSGYIINNEHCPANRSFIRVPMSVLLYCGDKDGGGCFPHWLQDRPSDTPWMVGDAHHAGFLEELIRAIDNHRVTTVDLTHKQRKQSRKAHKKPKDQQNPAEEGSKPSIQLDYKRVDMKQVVNRNDGKSGSVSVTRTGHSWTLTSRVSVRSHERVKIRRGLRPLQEDERAWLDKNQYRLYLDAADVPPDDAKRFSTRGQDGPDEDHWAAIKHKRVEEYEKGPEGANPVKVVRVPNLGVVNEVILPGNPLE